MKSLGSLPLLCVASLLAACSGSTTPPAAASIGDGGDDSAASVDAGPLAPPDPSCAGPCPTSKIKHLVILLQENHTFDTHFGRYCQAAAGSNPSCGDGPGCCEAMPAADPAGTVPTVLDDATEAGFDPNHLEACETAEIDNGAMDKFTNAPGCGSPRNVAVADPAIVKPYWDLAVTGALGDRYFQPTVGQSSANDMYFARAKFVFGDNGVGPKGAVGISCDIEGTPTEYTDTTIGDLLTQAAVPWSVFAEGYQSMVAANGHCPPKPDVRTAGFRPSRS